MNNENAKSFTSFISAFLVLLIRRFEEFYLRFEDGVEHLYFLFWNDDPMAKGKVPSSSGESTPTESTLKRVTGSER